MLSNYHFLSLFFITLFTFLSETTMAAQSTIQRGQKSLAFSVGNFDFMTTNHATAILAKEKATPDFHPVMDFLAQSPLNRALTHKPIFIPEVVGEVWQSAKVSEGKITITFGEFTYDITEDAINTALGLPVKQTFDANSNDDDIRNMFRSLNYAGTLDDLSEIKRPFLRKEWSFFFDQISKAFTGKCSGYDAITSITSQIGYSLLSNKVINIAKLLLHQMGTKMRIVETGRVKVYYHRFLMMLLLHFIPDLSMQAGTKIIKECYSQGVRIFSDLNRESVKLEAKLRDQGTPFPAMVYPEVMISKLKELDSVKYNDQFFSGAVAQGLEMENPSVPSPSTTSAKTKQPSKTKSRSLNKQSTK